MHARAHARHETCNRARAADPELHARVRQNGTVNPRKTLAQFPGRIVPPAAATTARQKLHNPAISALPIFSRGSPGAIPTIMTSVADRFGSVPSACNFLMTSSAWGAGFSLYRKMLGVLVCCQPFPIMMTKNFDELGALCNESPAACNVPSGSNPP